MIVATVKEGQAELAKLIDAAVAGEEVFISREGKRIVRLTVIDGNGPSASKRIPGGLAGKGYWISPQFDDPDPEINLMFQNGEA